jgi:hypothetical protein
MLSPIFAGAATAMNPASAVTDALRLNVPIYDELDE